MTSTDSIVYIGVLHKYDTTYYLIIIIIVNTVDVLTFYFTMLMNNIKETKKNFNLTSPYFIV